MAQLDRSHSKMEDEGCVKQILKYKPNGKRCGKASKQMGRSIKEISTLDAEEEEQEQGDYNL